MTSQPDPKISRRCLSEMLPQERREWAEKTYAELRAFSVYVQQYLDRRSKNQRKGRGRSTYTDERYNQFQVLAADLLAALEEIREEAEKQEGL